MLAGEITPGKPTWNQAYKLEHDAYETESYFSQSIGFFDTRSFGAGEDMLRSWPLRWAGVRQPFSTTSTGSQVFHSLAKQGSVLACCASIQS